MSAHVRVSVWTDGDGVFPRVRPLLAHFGFSLSPASVLVAPRSEVLIEPMRRKIVRWESTAEERDKGGFLSPIHRALCRLRRAASTKQPTRTLARAQGLHINESSYFLACSSPLLYYVGTDAAGPIPRATPWLAQSFLRAYRSPLQLQQCSYFSSGWVAVAWLAPVDLARDGAAHTKVGPTSSSSSGCRRRNFDETQSALDLSTAAAHLAFSRTHHRWLGGAETVLNDCCARSQTELIAV
jgi:hypothetical protein